MASSYDKLPLENALDETPQIISLVGVYTEDANYLGEYIGSLHQIALQLVAAHNKLTSTYQNLSKHLKNFTPRKYIPENDPSFAVTAELRKFSDIVSEMSTWQHILATQVADGVVYPLSQFIGSDLQEVNTLGTMYQQSCAEMDRAVGRYSRCRRRDPQTERHEAVQHVYDSKKNYHHIALKYYARLNELQLSRETSLLQPLLSLVEAGKGHHALAHEALASDATDTFLSTVGVRVNGVNEELLRDREETSELIRAIVAGSRMAYYPMPPADLAAMPPDTTLKNKSGYLNVHRKYMGVMSSWERHFVFLEAGHLMCVAPRPDNVSDHGGQWLAGASLLTLDASAVCHAAETDERVHVFAVSTSKKTVMLQGLNGRERDEWMIAIEAHCKERGEEGGDQSPSGNAPPTMATTTTTPPSSFFAGVTQFIADKLHPAPSSPSEASSPSPVAPSGGGDPLPPSNRRPRGRPLPDDAPIVFDLPAADDVKKADDSSEEEFLANFGVRFLGSMRVNVDTGQAVIFEVMRRILAARAIHDVFSASRLSLSVSRRNVVLTDRVDDKDDTGGGRRQTLALRDVAFWAAHPENERLFGYIARMPESSRAFETGDASPGFACSVFECEEGGGDGGPAISRSLGEAARAAYAHLLDQKSKTKNREEETQLIMENISMLPDKQTEPLVSPDGTHVVLEDSAKAIATEEKPKAKKKSSQETAPTERKPESEA